MNKFQDKKICLDVDGVISDFTSGILEQARIAGLEHKFPKTAIDVVHWNISPDFYTLSSKVSVDNNFWLNLDLLDGVKINFKPFYYLTARTCSSEITREWINKVGLPDSEVVTVRNPLDKIKVLKQSKPDLFIDDYFETIIEARKNGINAWLFKSPYQIGHPECRDLPTISSLSEIDKCF